MDFKHQHFGRSGYGLVMSEQTTRRRWGILSWYLSIDSVNICNFQQNPLHCYLVLGFYFPLEGTWLLRSWNEAHDNGTALRMANGWSASAVLRLFQCLDVLGRHCKTKEIGCFALEGATLLLYIWSGVRWFNTCAKPWAEPSSFSIVVLVVANLTPKASSELHRNL